MKFDASSLRFLSRDELRVLVSVEMGMKNHEIVPTSLIGSIAGLKPPLVRKAITHLHKDKLIAHDAQVYDGYKLTYLGYDFLAIKAMTHRETIAATGKQIGVGKEADVFLALDNDGNEICLKLHRLGRISFRTIKSKRDYMKHRKAASWLYMSRLAAIKEYTFMKALYDYGFPVPTPLDQSRHCVLMSLAKGYPLAQVQHIANPGKVFDDLMNIIIRLARHGLIHCDFNEFNLMIDDDEKITLIDFPQMVSTTHENAEEYFDRDVQCVVVFFERRFGFVAKSWPKLTDFLDREHNLDVTVEASGFHKSLQKQLESYFDPKDEENDAEENGEDDDDEDDEDEVDEVDNHMSLLDLVDNDNERETKAEEPVEEEKQTLHMSREDILQRTKDILLREREANKDNTRGELTTLDLDDNTAEFLLELTDSETTSTAATETTNDAASSTDERRPKKKQAKKNAPASEYIQQRVKQNLIRRSKVPQKKNSNKNRSKRSTAADIKTDSVWG